MDARIRVRGGNQGLDTIRVSCFDLRPAKQLIVTLDMEGVLTPEIWIAVAEKTGIPELRRTTRDELDYDKLMRGRLAILDRHGLEFPRHPKGHRLALAARGREGIPGRSSVQKHRS